MNIDKRTPEAIAQDINLLVSLGWVRDETPPYESGLFYQKDGKTAIVPKASRKKEHLDNPIFTADMFNFDGNYKYSDVNPLPF